MKYVHVLQAIYHNDTDMTAITVGVDRGTAQQLELPGEQVFAPDAVLVLDEFSATGEEIILRIAQVSDGLHEGKDLFSGTIERPVSWRPVSWPALTHFLKKK